jgi:hypothetical protein
MPSPDFIPIYGLIIESGIEDRGGVFNKESRAYRTYAAGYENFLKDAIRFLYRRGQKEEAQKYKDKLITWEKHNLNNPNRIAELSVPIDEFVRKELITEDRFAVPDVALSEIVASLQGAYTLGLMNGDMDLFRDQLAYAELFHKIFVERQIFNTNVNQGDRARMEFIIDRDFQVFAGSILAVMVAYMGGPDGSYMYANAPDELKAPAWLHLRSEWGGDEAEFRAMFPPPPERILEEYRMRVAARDDRRREFQGVLEQK